MNTPLNPVTAFLAPLAIDSCQEGGSGNAKALLTSRIMESARRLWNLPFISLHYFGELWQLAGPKSGDQDVVQSAHTRRCKRSSQGQEVPKPAI